MELRPLTITTEFRRLTTHHRATTRRRPTISRPATTRPLGRITSGRATARRLLTMRRPARSTDFRDRRMVTPWRACATLAPMGDRSSVNRADSHTAVGDGHRRLARQNRRGGRPSLAQAAQLRERILEVATELFLAEGYGTTSIEAVAERAGISKRTFYHRFDDKAALFAAVVQRIIKQIRPPPDVPLLEGSSPHAIL